jgi:diguanylate cyclase (GGDEF)-like protein
MGKRSEKHVRWGVCPQGVKGNHVAIKVLIVDDEEEICEIFVEMLKAYEYQPMAVTDGMKVLDLLWGERFDIVLLDLVLPNINGFDLLRQIRQSFEELPVVVVTGHGSIENAVASMQAGASDFVIKPVAPSVLDIRIRRAIEYVQTKRLANTDSLTDLYNRRCFEERLEQEVNRAMRYRRPLSLIMLDIDYFKLYNDTHGHLQGDKILVAVAHHLKTLSRASDMVARYGGEEFVLLLPETDSTSAEALGNRLREHIERQEFPGVEPLPEKALTISVGIASYTPPAPKENLLEAADMALYQAKRTGRNRVVVWASDYQVAILPNHRPSL